MAPNPLQLYRVHTDALSIAEVARTVTVSFSHDPLIHWLRPGAPLWARNDARTQAWQYRRIQRALLDGIVFRSASTAQLKYVFRSGGETPKQASVTTGCGPDEATDAGVVALLFPSKRTVIGRLKTVFLSLKLWVLDIIRPVVDGGTNMERVEQMMNSHKLMMDRIKSIHHLDNVWYLEVLAVHPSLQSRGLGGKAMNWLLDYINHEPLVLECTSEKNIGFYEALGFRVVEEVNLADNEGAVKCWIMLRDARRKE
ncbi:hypothetical protein FE257_010995 [Aspergillus nanangensis]|uniref:N-acetyltransferase domain-containing protein n=1 Tax=Aspergillus nanangensis TaxID=2582783 RepID=A0AAD4GRS6_ASPNN|nr:hypothetical protein FE257_010995 [Aspergillus nanangensis]